VGGRVILKAPHTRAEVIARTLAIGGYSMARGHLVGLAPDIKAHLECRGLIMGDGVVYAIPELEGRVAGVDMSHEAAVGKIAAEEVEYLMARGLDEDEAVSTIVRGFLNVKIEACPRPWRKKWSTLSRPPARGCNAKVKLKDHGYPCHSERSVASLRISAAKKRDSSRRSE
jgi:hypothetical protein